MSWGAIATAMTVASGVMQAYSMHQQGKAAKAEAEYRSAVQRNNEIRANYLAEDAIARGKEAERQERLRGRLLLGQIRVGLASSGQVVDEGSAGNMVIDQAGVNELDALTVRNNAEREAQGYRIQASQFGSEAEMTSISGSNARRNATLNSFGTLLGTGTKVASKWYQYDKKGWGDSIWG